MTATFSVFKTEDYSAFLKLTLIHAMFHTSAGVNSCSPTYSPSHGRHCSSHYKRCLALGTTMASQGAASDLLHPLLATSTPLWHFHCNTRLTWMSTLYTQPAVVAITQEGWGCYQFTRHFAGGSAHTCSNNVTRLSYKKDWGCGNTKCCKRKFTFLCGKLQTHSLPFHQANACTHTYL